MEFSVKSMIIGAARARASQIRAEITDLEAEAEKIETAIGEAEGGASHTRYRLPFLFFLKGTTTGRTA